MPFRLRVALLVDPLSARAPSAVRVNAARHASELAQALEARGHVARVFGIAAEHGGRALGLASLRPDAVLSYDALSPAAWLGSRIARRRRVPLVLVEAGSFAEGSWMERTAWRLGEVLWGGFVRRSASALVALDPVARDQALREGFRSERVRLLPHGVDLGRFRPGLVSPHLAQHRIRGRILFQPGPLDARSGAETLIHAFARTVGQREDWSLVFGSEGRTPPRLRACADRLGVGSRVFALALDDADLPALYSCSTLVALPALGDAPVGDVVARACACARPLIASDLPRLRYLVEPAGAGLFARPGDVEDWARVLRQAAAAPEARQRFGASGRRAAEQGFDWARIGAALEQVIAEAGLRLARPAPAAASLRAEQAG